MTTDRTRRSHHRVAILIALSTLCIAACSGSSDVADGASATQPGAEATETSSTRTIEPDVEETTVPRPEPASALASAIDALGVTYDFESEVATPAGDVVTVSGSRNGDASEFRITAGGAALDVIVIDQAVWLRQDGSDDWVTSTEAPSGDPLQALGTPLELRWAGEDASTLAATYSAASLGLDTDEDVAVEIGVGGTGMRFESVTGATRLVTTLRPSAKPAEIEPPTT
jgi:hypothetical protein